MLRHAAAHNRLAHGFLFLGPRGIGKRQFARLLAQCLFCEQMPDARLDACGVCSSCRQMQAGTHPDLLRIGLPEGKRQLPISLLIGDEKAGRSSGLCYELAHAPMSASRRMAIIDDADAMTEEASNALLKTLEEPPAGSILILLSPDAETILPTIRSRCQLVQFAPLTADQLRNLIAAQGINDSHLETVLPMAEGSLEMVRRLLDPGLQSLMNVVQKHLRPGRIDGLAARRELQAALDSLGGGPPEQRESLGWLLRFTIDSLRARLAETDNLQVLDQTGELLERCFLAEQHLRQTMPVPLCVEALFTELGRLSRSS